MSPQYSGTSSQALPPGYCFNEYQIEEVIGEGGFGIVYRAYDRELDRQVAIKEYIPASMVSRADDMRLVLRSERFTRIFQAGLISFIQEAKTLARFSHPGLVHVLRFWLANDTAYMVMQLYSGETLKSLYSRQPEVVTETWIRKMLPPLFSALKTLHDQGYLHRDIAPDNLQIQANGEPVLLDFGSACKEIGHLTDKTEIMLKPGYAPIEQYSEGRDGDQGPWTDIYALGAVLHTLIIGEPPPVSVVRSISDSYQPLAERQPEGYSRALLKTIDKMLERDPENRPQTITELEDILLKADTFHNNEDQPSEIKPKKIDPTPEIVTKTPPEVAEVSQPVVMNTVASRPVYIYVAAGAIAVIIALGVMFHRSPPEKTSRVAAASQNPQVVSSQAPRQTSAVAESAKETTSTRTAVAKQSGLVYLNTSQDATILIDGKQQAIHTGAGARLLTLAPGDYQLSVAHSGKTWQHMLHIPESGGTSLLKVPE